MHLEQLPEELLLQIALHLPDSGTPKHLKHLSLTSRKLRPISQEALFTTAKLTICCGCHPKVNALIKLLRTLLIDQTWPPKSNHCDFEQYANGSKSCMQNKALNCLGF